MGMVQTGSLQEGMILQAEVKDRTGRILLGAGQELTKRHIRLFKMWGVIEADIQGVDQEEISAQEAKTIDPMALQEAEQKTRELFARAGMDHPAMKELARLITQRRLRVMMEGEHGKQSA
jgi:hypothetical protein